jgi:dephospho-CoA kinase
VAVEGAVLIEANAAQFFDELWVLTLDRKIAFDRVTKRNPNLSAEEINDRFNRQLTDTERLQHATWSFDTGGSIEENMKLVDQRLLKMKATENLII